MRQFFLYLLIFASQSLGSISAQELKRDILFDSDWKFHLGKEDGAEKVNLNDTKWRSLNLPHDWSIEDLSAEYKLQSPPELIITPGSWFFTKGDDMSRKQPDCDVSNWEKVILPSKWENHSNYTQDKAYGWYRKEIVIPDSLSGKDILLGIGAIDDVDETYFNGQLIGHTGSFPPNFVSARAIIRKYKIPKELIKKDKNYIAIRVYDDYGDGGLLIAAKPQIVSGPFDSDAISSYNTGYTVGGTGWYRKHFKLPRELADKMVSVNFDGVYMNADVWINGHHLGNHPYGYTAFGFDLSNYLNYGDSDNVIAVEVKNEGINSRWYSGSGIYRHVYLDVTDKIHVAKWGTFISTSSADSLKASLNVKTTVDNYTSQNTDITVTYTILNSELEKVATKKISTQLYKNYPSVINLTFDIPKPDLWSPEWPGIYKAICEIAKDGRVIDKTETKFGIRFFRFDVEKGLSLNGKSIKLKGGSMHSNNGPLGAIANDRAEERRVELMIAAGFNAVRCSHNPPSTTFLDACDRLGMMVIDEAFDVWTKGWRPDDYHVYFKDWWKTDMAAMVMRDRNHPSIFTWSIGNQIRENSDSIGISLAYQIAGFVRSLDPTRPVSANVAQQKGAWRNCKPEDWRKCDPFFAALDICGYSYQSSQYESDHQRLPDRLMFSSEIDPRHSFDNWMHVIDKDYVMGNFEWTAMDFFGEVALGWWGFSRNHAEHYPWTSTYSGDLDLCGFKRPRSYYRDVLFKRGCKLSAFVFAPVSSFEGPGDSPWGWDDVKQSWTWPGYEGKNLNVVAYSACDSVQLFLNDKLIGCKTTSRQTEFKANWQVPYEQGTLKAIGYAKGLKIAEWKLVTAQEPSKIQLTADRTNLKADGQDLSYVTVEITDKNGNLNPQFNNLINFIIEGEGTIAAVGNSNPTSVESFQQPYRKAYEGKCLVIVRSKINTGQIILHASGKGLTSGKIIIKTKN